jgi:hypothetical protein
MKRECSLWITVALALTLAFTASAAAQADPQCTCAKERKAGDSDPAALATIDVTAILRDGVPRKPTDPQDLIRDAEEHIAAIKARKCYDAADVDILTSPWVRTKEFVELIRQGRPLPEIKLASRTQRNGVFDCAGASVFKGDAKRAVELVREIGLRDTANGKSWSDAWGIMERSATPLGMKQNGDLLVRVDVVLAINKPFEFIYKQVFNVRDVERYCEYDLGNGGYVVVQDLVQDDSKGARPRGTKRNKKWAPKEYFPIKEQISITIIRDNKDGTFTLGNFMSTHGQELKAISGGADFLTKLLFIDLQEEMKKDSIKNRQKWNDLFQKAVLDPEAG